MRIVIELDATPEQVARAADQVVTRARSLHTAFGHATEDAPIRKTIADLEAIADQLHAAAEKQPVEKGGVFGLRSGHAPIAQPPARTIWDRDARP